jgi:hypothetical protein
MLLRRIRRRDPVTVLYTPTRPDGDWDDEWFGRALAQQEVLWADDGGHVAVLALCRSRSARRRLERLRHWVMRDGGQA